MNPGSPSPGRVVSGRRGLGRLLVSRRARGLAWGRARSVALSLVGVFAAAAPLPAAESAPTSLRFEVGPVRFDLEEEQSGAELGIVLLNSSPTVITVHSIRSSCGCTLLRTPALPWRLAPGATGPFSARVDLRGKAGELHKTVTVETSAGPLTIPVRITIPAPPISEERRRNQLLALADARAIFRGECVKCHVAPATGKVGAELYQAACGICHEASPRASAVPDLPAAPGSRTPEHWRQWIEHGKPGSLMPPFAQAHGGILTPEQVDSLVRFLTARP